MARISLTGRRHADGRYGARACYKPLTGKRVCGGAVAKHKTTAEKKALGVLGRKLGH